MRYFKVIRNGYILTIGTGAGGMEISEDEYRELHNVFLNRPDYDGNIYELRADTVDWEQTGVYEAEQEDLSDSEALAIIMGGSV